MKRLHRLAVAISLLCALGATAAPTYDVVINLQRKTVNVTNAIAFRETVPVLLVNIGGATPANLVLRVVGINGRTLALSTNFVASSTNASGTISLNTAELAQYFTNMPAAAVRTATLGVWDVGENRLLVNDLVTIRNNPYSPGAPGPSPIGQTYVPAPTNVWPVGAAILSSTTGQTTYAGTVTTGGVSVIVVGETNVTAANLIANGGAGLTAATLYRGDWGAAASNLAASGYVVATSAASTASAASTVATGAWLQAVSASNLAAAAWTVATNYGSGAASGAITTLPNGVALGASTLLLLTNNAAAIVRLNGIDIDISTPTNTSGSGGSINIIAGDGTADRQAGGSITLAAGRGSDVDGTNGVAALAGPDGLFAVGLDENTLPADRVMLIRGSNATTVLIRGGAGTAERFAGSVDIRAGIGVAPGEHGDVYVGAPGGDVDVNAAQGFLQLFAGKDSLLQAIRTNYVYGVAGAEVISPGRITLDAPLVAITNAIEVGGDLSVAGRISGDLGGATNLPIYIAGGGGSVAQSSTGTILTISGGVGTLTNATGSGDLFLGVSGVTVTGGLSAAVATTGWVRQVTAPASTLSNMPPLFLPMNSSSYVNYQGNAINITGGRFDIHSTNRNYAIAGLYCEDTLTPVSWRAIPAGLDLWNYNSTDTVAFTANQGSPVLGAGVHNALKAVYQYKIYGLARGTNDYSHDMVIAIPSAAGNNYPERMRITTEGVVIVPQSIVASNTVRAGAFIGDGAGITNVLPTNSVMATVDWYGFRRDTTNDNLGVAIGSALDALTSTNVESYYALATTTSNANQNGHALATIIVPVGHGGSSTTNLVLYAKTSQLTTNVVVFLLADTWGRVGVTQDVQTTRTAVSIPWTGILTNLRQGDRVGVDYDVSVRTTNAANVRLIGFDRTARFER